MRGIYRIFNKENGRMYIGSTSDFNNRINCHAKELKEGHHNNLYLQDDFNQYPREVFLYQFLEEVDGPLEGVERKYIKSIDSNLLYNIDLEIKNIKKVKVNNGRFKPTKSLVKLLTKYKYFSEEYVKSLSKSTRIPFKVIYKTLNTLIDTGKVKKNGNYYIRL